MDEEDALLTWRKGNELVASRGNERFLAERVLDERKQRGWSQAQLSKELAKVGSPLQQSAISKIESPPKGERRSISIGEAIGFARVFGIPLGELLLPPDAIWDGWIFDGLARAAELFEAARLAREALDDAIFKLEWLDPVDEEGALRTKISKYWQRDIVDSGLEKYGDLEPVDQIDIGENDMRGWTFMDEAILIKRYLKATNVATREKIDQRLRRGEK